MVLHGPVDHVFPGLGVKDGLRCPHPFQFLLSRVALLHVDDRVRPVDEVGRLLHDKCPVGVPAVVRYHVGHYHVERLAVLTAQYVRVAHAAGRADGLRVDDRLVAVQRTVSVAVGADGIAHGFLADVVACEVSEQVGRTLVAGVVGLLRLCGERCGQAEAYHCRRLSDDVFHGVYYQLLSVEFTRYRPGYIKTPCLPGQEKCGLLSGSSYEAFVPRSAGVASSGSRPAVCAFL